MHLRTTTDIRLLIRERRRALRLDQAELARRVGVSRQWIIGIEKGKARADMGLVLRTIEALGIMLRAAEPASTDASAHAATHAGTAASRSMPVVSIDDILAAHRGRGSRASGPSRRPR